MHTKLNANAEAQRSAERAEKITPNTGRNYRCRSTNYRVTQINVPERFRLAFSALLCASALGLEV
jgi:hypothetical protein